MNCYMKFTQKNPDELNHRESKKLLCKVLSAQRIRPNILCPALCINTF